MHRSSLVVVAALVIAELIAAPARAQDRTFSAEITRETALRVMTATADWQLAHPSDHAPDDWTQAAFSTGMMALSGVADSSKYADAMRAMGEKNRWRPGPRPGHADDWAVIATYAQLYQIDKDPRQLAPALALFDFLAARKYDEPLTWDGSIGTRELAWCDALFMGPPAMAAVSTATGDIKYLDLANRLWWKTSDFLYDREERLYFRDSRYFDPREKNGKKIFWSRGNGWVLAGLARLLQDMPQNYPDRARYLALFRDMAERIAALQSADGYWRSSLLDPDSRPNPETSGTGFFTYGLAWGINHGVLSRATYEPHVRRGWDAMVKAVRADGMLGWVQRIGAEPGATTADTTEVYGVGALLLAGSEIFRMATPLPREAERALALGPFSVMQKTRLPPSGDKHDFLTLAPYWWPDPTKPGGLPYLRRDGDVNPESKQGTDDTAFAQMTETVMTLAAAYRDTRDERFATRTGLLLRTWFLDPETRMNPNLDYGQAIPGRNTGRAEGIISTRHLVRIVDAARLLATSSSWTPQDRAGLQAWCAQFTTWLQTSKNGRDESAAANNHGTWYEAQLSALLLFNDKHDEARARFEKATQRLAAQIEPDGRQPQELARTRAWSYSVMNLEGWFTVARLAEEAGADLWNFRTNDGRSLRTAVDYLVPFAAGEAKWPHPQVTPFDMSGVVTLLDRAAIVWRSDRYAALADRLRASGSMAMMPRVDLPAIERARVLSAADVFLRESPVTVTASRATRSAGGLHDFFSEGDYWWPDPKNPDGPYIQRDGMTNPANFVDHRRAMVRFSIQVGTLTSAYVLTRDERYAAHALAHLRAWFIDESTKMAPHLLYAQAIHGRFTGRGVGIIDTIHLVEVARAAGILATSRSAQAAEVAAVKRWFADYLTWLNTHQYGLDERDARNNHATCWVMQVAAFAQLTGDTARLDEARRRYKEILLPSQMGPDGSFPAELARTKPYGYSLFNLDAFATICQILSTPGDDLWRFTLPDGRGMRLGLSFLFPYMKNKSAWPHAKDVMYFDDWPVRHPSLLFGGLAFDVAAYLDLWQALAPPPAVEEVIRNMPIRHPLLWL